MNDNDPPPVYNDDDLPSYVDVIGVRPPSPEPQPSTSRNIRPYRSRRPRSDTIITISDTGSHHSNINRPNVRILTHQISSRSGAPPPISVRNEIFESLLGYMALLVFVFCCVILFRFIVVLQERK